MKPIQIGQQRNWRKWLVGGAGLAVLVALSLVAWSLFKPTAAASGTLEAVTLETSAADATIYTIAAGDAEARFLIDEVLRGEDVTVVGTTDQVAGELSFNYLVCYPFKRPEWMRLCAAILRLTLARSDQKVLT